MPSAVGGASGATSSWLSGWDQSSGARLTAMAAAAASSSSMLDSSVAEAASEAALAASCALVADASSGVGRWVFLTGGAAQDDDDVDVDDPDEVVLSAATVARDEPCGTRLTAFGGSGGGGGTIPLGEGAVLRGGAVGAASRAVAISSATALALEADTRTAWAVSLTACWRVADGDGDVVVDEAVVRDTVGPRAARVRVLDSESSLALSSFQLSLATTPPGALVAAALATAVRLTAALPLDMVPSSLYMATVARALWRFSS
jgi:hypothetical protein